MEPKNGGSEDDFPFQLGDFQVPAVNFPRCTLYVATSQSLNSCFFFKRSILIFRGVIKHVVCMQRRSLLFLTHSDRETGLWGCDCF